MPIVIGVLLAAAVAAFAKVTRFDQDRSFYSTVLVIVASYYVLFAVMGDSTHALVQETIVGLLFSVAAVFGAVRLPVLIGIGLVAHGLFDLIHHAIIPNPGVPSWWPAFCMSFDAVLGLWVIGLYRSRRYAPARGPH
ncbi:hypothetical protein YTPLAS18_11820 [Nitrospira sp.]|nr:hypothetical protein YTPLAS18_11820 [Nitrospira sp.]